MYYLIEYSDNYSQTSGTLWQYYKAGLALDDSDVADFNAENITTNLFKIKKTNNSSNKRQWHK